VFAATPTPGTPAAGGVTSIKLKFTTAPANNYLNVQSGDTLNGIYKMDEGQYKIFEVLHLATADGSNKPAPTSFDAAMTSGFVFDLYACKQSSSGTCDFQSALVRAGEANQWVPPADESNPWAEGGAYSMRIN